MVDPTSTSTLLITVEGITGNQPSLPGILYIWQGLPVTSHMTSRGYHGNNMTSSLPGYHGYNMTSGYHGYNTSSPRLLAILSHDLTRTTVPTLTLRARGPVVILYEGVSSSHFDLSYSLLNCTYNCRDGQRFNSTGGLCDDCRCRDDRMGPQCGYEVCPGECKGTGTCVTSTGQCNVSNVLRT
eukprot:sb/3471553/